MELGGDRLISGVRFEARGKAVAVILRVEFPYAKLLVRVVYMSSYCSAQDFAARCTSELDRFDLVMHSAGTRRFQLRYDKNQARALAAGL